MDSYQEQKPLRQNQLRWAFIWAVTTVFSIVAGYAILDALPDLITDYLNFHPILSVFLYGIFWGSVVGFFQWLLLRIRAARTIWWIPFNIAGYTLMLLCVHIIDILSDQYWDQLMQAWFADPSSTFYNFFTTLYGDIYLSDVSLIISLSLVFGIIVGISQWLALRMFRRLPEQDDQLDDAPQPPQIPPIPRISASWIPIHLLSTILAGWISMKAYYGYIPTIFFFILYSLISTLAFAPFLNHLLRENKK